jgi:hypothetical protein
MSVKEYVTKFTQLSRYAPHEVDTDEKKQEYFLNGLNDGLTYALMAQDFENFETLASMIGHSFHIANTLRHSLELPTSLLQASFKSKLSGRDLSLILE